MSSPAPWRAGDDTCVLRVYANLGPGAPPEFVAAVFTAFPVAFTEVANAHPALRELLPDRPVFYDMLTMPDMFTEQPARTGGLWAPGQMFRTIDARYTNPGEFVLHTRLPRHAARRAISILQRFREAPELAPERAGRDPVEFVTRYTPDVQTGAEYDGLYAVLQDAARQVPMTTPSRAARYRSAQQRVATAAGLDPAMLDQARTVHALETLATPRELSMKVVEQRRVRPALQGGTGE